MTGERINAALDRLAGHATVSRHGERSVITGPGYRAIVVVSPQRWLGLEFRVLGDDGRSRLTYYVDTNRHDPTHPRFHQLVAGVEDEIVAFLDALATGHIRVGTVKRRLALAIPDGRLVVKGRFSTSVRPGQPTDAFTTV